MPNAVERTLSRERLRQRRDALLLELGALVYELHRQGRRAPELLQGRRASSTSSRIRCPPTRRSRRRPAPPAARRPSPGSSLCLNCGARLGLGRRPVSIPTALAVAIAVVVVGAAAFGFAISELTSGSDGDGDSRPR